LTLEKVEMPSTIRGIPFLKTKWARKGLILSPGVVDAGFKGQLNLSIFNSSENTIHLTPGEKIAQLIFDKINPPEKTYAARSGNYQNQNKIIK
jgi:dCTP deaminase